MDPPKFDGTSPHTIVHWLLAVEQCGVVQLIEDDTRVVSYAMSNLRGKASEWAYSALMANADAFTSWAIFKSKIRAMYQPPNNEVLLMARFLEHDRRNALCKSLCRRCVRCRRPSMCPIPEHT